MHAFSRGISSVLDLYSIAPKDDLDFEYNGKNVTQKTSKEELSSAWEAMGALMNTFLDRQSKEFGES